jgi:hypothetical protein
MYFLMNLYIFDNIIIHFSCPFNFTMKMLLNVSGKSIILPVQLSKEFRDEYPINKKPVKELVNSSNEVSQSMKYNMFGRIQYSGTKCPSC